MKITRAMIKRMCSDIIYRRGAEYFAQGRVHINKRNEDGISAIVDGQNVYTVRIVFGENSIKDTFCTCPYYSTMQTNCKHISATLQKYAYEQESGKKAEDDNDRIALELCEKYEREFSEKKHINVWFSLNVSTINGYKYSCALSVGEEIPRSVANAEGFINAYSTGGEFKLGKNFVYSPYEYSFGEAETQVLDILAESYQNRAASSFFYTPTESVITFSAMTAKRLLPILTKIGMDFVFNGVSMNGARVHEETPDIIVEIMSSASDKISSNDITITSSDFGRAVVPDGEWFVFEGDLYHTDAEWRKWYMPIYNALVGNERSRLNFYGSNTMAFAGKILPRLKNKHGAELSGIEDIIVDDKPIFEVYLDRENDSITALVKVSYGNINITMPENDSDEIEKAKILVRDIDAEQKIINLMTNFDVSGHVYVMSDNDKIYDFLKYTVSKLSEIAAVYMSERLKKMDIHYKEDINVNVKYNESINLLETEIETELEYSEIEEILGAIRLKERFYRKKDGSFLDISENDSLNAFELLDKLEFNKTDLKSGKKKIPTFYAMYLEALSESDFLNTDVTLDDFLKKLKNIQADIPDNINSVLRDYQREGVNWFKQLSTFGFGGILADDMGLGKTLQVIAFVCSEKKNMPSLIVTPSALTYNWLSEINKFAPEAKAVIIDGNKDERIEKLSETGNNSVDFIITSYPLLRRDIAMYKEKEFSYMFIDEAQYIKNPKTMNARSVKKIKAGGYFALTGTPIENSLTELWSIFDYAVNGYLYSHSEFASRFEKNIARNSNTTLAERTASDLRKRIKPFVMRRMKADVLEELPEKIENTVFADLIPEQRMLYDAYLLKARSEVSQIIEENGEKNKSLRILALLMRLRQICCHPSLFDAAYKKDSGKLDLLKELTLSAIDSGHRVLIFSQFTSMLNIIKSHLKEFGISVFYIDGATPSHERIELADRFNSGEADVFLVSLKAGGTGLNLVGADTVIHYDPWWNPAVMDQASDRAYRIGQTKAVQVIKLAARNTVEEKIIRLQDRKRMLANDIIRANEAALSSLSKQEIMALFED